MACSGLLSVRPLCWLSLLWLISGAVLMLPLSPPSLRCSVRFPLLPISQAFIEVGALTNSRLMYKLVPFNCRTKLTFVYFVKKRGFSVREFSLKTNVTKYRCVPLQLSAFLFKLCFKVHKDPSTRLLRLSFLLTSLCSFFCPSLPVLLIPGVTAPVALPAYARRPPFPVQTFPQHGERGRGRIAPLAPRQAPLAQPQVAWNCTAPLI